ncbi:MAG: folylpolyglutamate synthase/dihydrofolate synthase family protein [Capsulimonadales bacterium]|nr:folylpolyglutamate synthase/dihydrofolate synthase family protein [Capsulimonadales bacterium]
MPTDSRPPETMTFEDAVQYMSGLVAFAPRTDRTPFRRLLARLGNPQNRLRCLHVAGTNGKGSTVTFLASVLTTAGYRVGSYLSPYVFDMRERYRIDGEMIPKAEFARLVTGIRPHLEAVTAGGDGPITEFELKTAVAFVWFAEQRTDFAVIEVGIGGRLDSTNVIPPPLCAAIVSIGWDHMNLLGDTLGKIAAEKAGIFKPGSVGVTAVEPGEALTAIRLKADETGIPLHLVRPAAAPDADSALVRYRGLPGKGLTLHLPSESLPDLSLTLRGAYQAQNAATAAGVLETLRQRKLATVSTRAFRIGLERAHLPGRFQLARRTPATLLLDGAHNEDGARTLVEALRAEFGPDVRCTFVLGFSKNHDPEPFLRVLAPLAERIVATEPTFRPRPCDEITRAAERHGIPSTEIPVARDAIGDTYAAATPDAIVVVTGSFYTVGETPEELRG